MVILAGHCSLTGQYFEPCLRRKRYARHECVTYHAFRPRGNNILLYLHNSCHHSRPFNLCSNHFVSLNLLSMHDLLRKKKYARRECVTYIKTCYRSVLLVQCSSGAWPLILWTPSFWCWLLVCLWIMPLMLRTHSWLYLAHDTVGFLTAFHCYCFILSHSIISLILLHEKFLQFDWLRTVVFQLNLKYLHVKITNLLLVVA